MAWAGLLFGPVGQVRAENAVRFSDAAGEPGGTVTVDVTIENNVVIAGAAVPFRWSSPDLTLDSIIFVRDRYRGTITTKGDTTSTARRMGAFLLLRGLVSPGWIDEGSGVVARLKFRVGAQAPAQWVIVDSVYGTPGGTVPFAQFSDFSGAHVILPNVYPGTITIGQPSGQASMVLVPDRLEFHGIWNGAAPPTQWVSIRSVEGPPFTWTISSTGAWLRASPASGSSPGDLQVSVDLATLGAGDYADTIVIGSPQAVNSPVRLPVTLRVEENTQLVVSPGRLEFRSVKRAPNPSSQNLRLGTTNEVPLAWSAQKAATWLLLDPASGDQLGLARVSVDAVTLDTGEYNDTIVITAQGATNSPVRIPVVLFVDTAASIPLPNALFQNRPNPFSTYHDPATSIGYTIEQSGHIDITLYDVLGRPVRHLLTGDVTAGAHQVTWDGRDDRGRMVASGHYFYRMKTSNGTVTRKMVVIK